MYLNSSRLAVTNLIEDYSVAANIKRSSVSLGELTSNPCKRVKLELATLLNLVLHYSSEDLQDNDKEKGESSPPCLRPLPPLK